MSLNGVCELSSILRVDDLERSELQRKKSALEAAVSQQEGRLVYEIDECSRYVRESEILEERVVDIQSKVEMLELCFAQTSSAAAASHSVDDIQVYLNSYSAEPLKIEKLLSSVQQCEALIAATSKHPRLNSSQTTEIVQSSLATLTTKVAEQRAQQEHILSQVEAKKAQISDIDESTADVSQEIDDLQGRLAQQEQLFKHEEGTLEDTVRAMQADSRKADAQCSAELGRMTDAIAKSQEQKNAETQTLERIETEAAETGAKITQLKGSVEQLRNQLQGEADRKVSCEKRIQELTRMTADLDMAIARTRSEIDATKNLLRTCAHQSFQSRADALLADVEQAQQAMRAIDAEIEATRNQIEGSAENEQVQSLRRAAHASAAAYAQSLGAFSAAERRLQEFAVEHDRVQLQAQALEKELEALQTSTAQQGLRLQELRSAIDEATAPSCVDIPSVEQLRQEEAEVAEQLAAEAEASVKLQKGADLARTRMQTKQSEVAVLQQQLAQRQSVARDKFFATEKIRRVEEARAALIESNRAEVAGLEKLLLEEDRRFQQMHLEAAARKEQRKASLDAEVIRLRRAIDDLREKISAARSSGGGAGHTGEQAAQAEVATELEVGVVDPVPVVSGKSGSKRRPKQKASKGRQQ